jgi:GTP-binding protein Era
MTTRAGFVALIGEPNAGKSTLLNRMVGAKVSIVTHKVQTTRARIRGVAMEGDAQLVFVDTPGLFRPRRGSTGPWWPRPGAGRRMRMSWCC